MAYNQNIPQASDDPSQSQGQLLANFQALDTFLALNHVELNASGEGKHKFLQMPEQASAPTTASDEGGLYTKDVSGATQLFFRRESSGDEYQLTGAFTAAQPGSLVFPGGLIFNWGAVTAGSGGASQSWNTAFTSSVFSVLATSLNNSASSNATVENITLTQATFFSTSLNAVFYLAIGS